MIQCGMIIRQDNSDIVLSPDNAEFSGNEFINAVLKRDYPIFLFQVVHTKLYNRDFLNKSRVKFDTNVIVSTDCLFNTMLLPYFKKVKFINAAKYFYMQNHSFLTKRKASYDQVFQSIKVGVITSGIRNDLIHKLKLNNNPDVLKGFNTSICNIYLSNAREIENGKFTKDEKNTLYNAYFSSMDYPVYAAIDDCQRTDQMIIEASANKKRKTISRIYRLRKIKKKLLETLK